MQNLRHVVDLNMIPYSRLSDSKVGANIKKGNMKIRCVRDMGKKEQAMNIIAHLVHHKAGHCLESLMKAKQKKNTTTV